MPVNPDASSIPVLAITMPAVHREHHYTPLPKMITFTLEPRSRSAGIGVHVVPETTITMSRNTQKLA